MRVLLALTFRASKKEPLAELVERVAAAFKGAGIEAPVIRFILADGSTRAAGQALRPFLLPRPISSVDRVLKRLPELSGFLSTTPVNAEGFTTRQLSNAIEDPTLLPLGQLLEIARGVPKSFPFPVVRLSFGAPEFGVAPEAGTDLSPRSAPMIMAAPPGVTISDTWWVNGRERALAAHVVIDVDADRKSLPPLPDKVAAIAKALGKYKTDQIMLREPASPDATPVISVASGTPASAQPVQTQIPPEVTAEIMAIVRRHRDGFAATVARARMPHDLLSSAAAYSLPDVADREPTGPKKPVLQAAFQPFGYDVKGGSATYTLRRKTPGNLTIEILLDVGTWSRKLSGVYGVIGLGFRAPHPLTVSPNDATPGLSYPISGSQQWQQMVENLAALVAEIDRTFPAEIEAVAGPSPAWYEPPTP